MQDRNPVGIVVTADEITLTVGMPYRMSPLKLTYELNAPCTGTHIFEDCTALDMDLAYVMCALLDVVRAPKPA